MNDDEYKKWLRGNGVEPEPEEDNSVTVYGMSIWAGEPSQWSQSR